MKGVFIRNISILTAFSLGYLFPELHLFGWLIKWLIILMLFITFLGIRTSRIKVEKKHYLLVMANLIIGVCAFLIPACFHLKDLAQAAFFAGITPTATAAPVITGFLGGNVEFVTTALLFDNALIGVSLPLILPEVTGQGGWEIFIHIAMNVFAILALPYIAAIFVRKLKPAALAWPIKLKNLSFSLWVAVLLLIVSNATHDIQTSPEISPGVLWQIAGVSLIICMINFVIGHMIGGLDRKRECSQALGQKNTTLTIILAMTYASPVAALGPTFYVLWHNLWNSIQMYRAGKYRK